MTVPLVSILTPSYDQAPWLSDNLSSVACQSHPEVEHIVVDGGSTDGSVEILQAAGSSVRWVTGPDRGQADAVNKAFSMSSGEIIGWINSDDAYFDRRVIADVVEFLETHPGCDVVYGHCAQVTDGGLIIQMLWAPSFDHELWKTTNVIMQPSVFVRRRVLREPMLDESYHFAMDYELWLRLAAQGARFARINRVLSIDRHQRGRKSITARDVHASDMRRLHVAYGIHLPGSHEWQRTRFYVRQRLAGAFLMSKVRPPLAFTHPDDLKRGLLRRQLLTRRSRWPDEYR